MRTLNDDDVKIVNIDPLNRIDDASVLVPVTAAQTTTNLVGECKRGEIVINTILTCVVEGGSEPAESVSGSIGTGWSMESLYVRSAVISLRYQTDDDIGLGVDAVFRNHTRTSIVPRIGRSASTARFRLSMPRRLA